MEVLLIIYATLFIFMDIVIYVGFERRIHIEYKKPIDEIIQNRIANYTEEKMLLERKLFVMKHKEYMLKSSKNRDKKKKDIIIDKISMLEFKLRKLKQQLQAIKKEN